MIVPGRGVTPITAAHDLRPTYGTPQGDTAHPTTAWTTQAAAISWPTSTTESPPSGSSSAIRTPSAARPSMPCSPPRASRQSRLHRRHHEPTATPNGGGSRGAQGSPRNGSGGVTLARCMRPAKPPVVRDGSSPTAGPHRSLAAVKSGVRRTPIGQRASLRRLVTLTCRPFMHPRAPPCAAARAHPSPPYIGCRRPAPRRTAS